MQREDGETMSTDNESMSKLKYFLETYPNTKIVVAQTIKDGHIVTIKPIPTISGAEVHCAPDMHQKVLSEIRDNQNQRTS